MLRLLSVLALLGAWCGEIRMARAQESGEKATLPAQSANASAAPAREMLPAQSANASAAPARETLPNLLARIAPTIVKVRRGSSWGTGVVFGTRRTVVTSFELVNGPGDLQVVIANGTSHTPQVTAWAPADDIAVLDLDVDATSEPLPPARGELHAGVPATLLYEPRDLEFAADVSGGWVAPLPRFTQVSRVLPAEINLDLSVWSLRGDDGAPVVSASGELIGIISRRTAKESRTIVTPVARIERLLPSRAQQGIFSPASAGRWFTGVFVTPFYTTMFDAARERSAFFGAGVAGGYHYKSLFADLSFGIFQSSSRRLSASVDQTTDRVLLELTPGAEFEIVKGIDGFFGPGLSLALDTLETTTLIDGSAPHNTQSDRARARPLLTLGFASGAFFCRDVFVLSSPGEARLDLGFLFGARNFR